MNGRPERVEFSELFQTALGEQRKPFRFQESFATSDALPSLVRIPTGLGKTATVVLGWIWRRFHAAPEVREATPRRLVYCLPMRTLVEQTKKLAETWVKKLGLSEELNVHVLMGGEQVEDWDLYPERPAILIGTQDMLLSRALNRGYAMSRYRWPIPFGLLNNDCLWVFDEVQLMDVGVATSAQLEGFRRDMKALGNTQTVWMSATLQQSWLETVDLPRGSLSWRLELSEEDLQSDYVKKLWKAPKPQSKADAPMGDPGACADAIAEAHRAGTKTIAVFNTVRQAVAVYKQLSKKSGLPETVLLHSRFRPNDRKAHLDAFLEGHDVIAVTTQVVEAGVDVSATTLLTELAPWSSLVQRFGRCNRKGDDQHAAVRWFDPGEMDDKFNAAPYEAEDLRQARDLLLAWGNVSLEALDRIKADMPLVARHVIRRRDLIDLFDTTPDLAGNDIDISRFIRSGDEHDVRVFWREFEDGPDERAPRREELCSVPFLELRQFRRKKKGEIWRWDGLEGDWRKADDRAIYPGQTYLVRAAAGGYEATVGWKPDSRPVTPVRPVEGARSPDAQSRDFEDGPWLSIARHTDDVVNELNEILEKLALDQSLRESLQEAARWHDWGKAHEVFQEAVKDEDRPPEWRQRAEPDIGKAPDRFWKPYDRRGFRHELASALGMLALGRSDLSVYLAAAHHGKVRLSIRSMPNEKRPQVPERLYSRGVWDGDVLPDVNLGGGVTARETRVALEPMQMGRSPSGAMSWAERMLRLRDEYGPFQLAYLEALLRAADMRASKGEAKRAPEECP